jgi:hypothetical protein
MNSEQKEAYALLLEMFVDAEPLFLMEACSSYRKDNRNIIVQKVVEKIGNSYMPLKSSNNKQLIDLLEIFPVEPSYAREQIKRYKFKAIENLLLLKEYPKRMTEISELDLFKTQEYIKDALQTLLDSFPYHWEYTVRGILSENNNDFTSSYQILKQQKLSFFSKILPRRQPSNTLISDILKSEINLLNLQDFNDLEYAQKINYDQYEQQNQLITCNCCFSDCTFEDLITCTNSHLTCKKCIEKLISIGMYETGNVRGKILKCMDQQNCSGYFTLQILSSFLPQDLFSNYQSTLILKETQNAGLKIVSCPFCDYFEEAPGEYKYQKLYEKVKFMCENVREITIQIGKIFAVIFFITSSRPFESLYILMMFYLLTNHLNFDRIETIFRTFPEKLKPRIAVLNCKKPKCRKETCIECKQLWGFGHVCFEKEKDSRRVFVEMAMSNALIRNCSNCDIRFSKVDGCNKMTCPLCKHVMCYVCRMDIKDVGYKHFCQVLLS